MVVCIVQNLHVLANLFFKLFIKRVLVILIVTQTFVLY